MRTRLSTSVFDARVLMERYGAGICSADCSADFSLRFNHLPHNRPRLIIPRANIPPNVRAKHAPFRTTAAGHAGAPARR